MCNGKKSTEWRLRKIKMKNGAVGEGRTPSLHSEWFHSFFVFNILRHILKNMKAKSSSQIGPFFYTMFANRARAKTMLARSEREFFSPNCSKFAVECDWES